LNDSVYIVEKLQKIQYNDTEKNNILQFETFIINKKTIIFCKAALKLYCESTIQIHVN